MGREFELERGRNVVRHKLFQEAMDAMNRLGEELAGVDLRLEAEGLGLVEERRKLRVAINLGRYHRDLENAKAEAVGILGTGVPRLACLRPTAWLRWGPSAAHLHQHRLKTLARGQASRGGRQEASSEAASSGRLARRRRDQCKGTS